MINGKFKAQVVAMVSPEMKADMLAEADRRDISLGALVREDRELAKAVKERPRPSPDSFEVGHTADGSGYIAHEFANQLGQIVATETLTEIRGVGGELIRSQVIPEGDVDGADTLAGYARSLTPDTEPDEVDGSLGENDDAAARVARLRARGLG